MLRCVTRKRQVTHGEKRKEHRAELNNGFHNSFDPFDPGKLGTGPPGKLEGSCRPEELAGSCRRAGSAEGWGCPLPGPHPGGDPGCRFRGMGGKGAAEAALCGGPAERDGGQKRPGNLSRGSSPGTPGTGAMDGWWGGGVLGVMAVDVWVTPYRRFDFDLPLSNPCRGSSPPLLAIRLGTLVQVPKHWPNNNWPTSPP